MLNLTNTTEEWRSHRGETWAEFEERLAREHKAYLAERAEARDALYPQVLDKVADTLCTCGGWWTVAQVRRSLTQYNLQAKYTGSDGKVHYTWYDVQGAKQQATMVSRAIAQLHREGKLDRAIGMGTRGEAYQYTWLG